jgi:hypothetical protein
MPSSFPKPFELVHGMICLFKYAGILSLEKIVGSTVKMQYVRTRKAQPHSPSPMTLAGKGIFQSTRINQRLTCPCSIRYWRTLGHSVSESFELLMYNLPSYSTPVTMSHMMLSSKHITTTSR